MQGYTQLYKAIQGYTQLYTISKKDCCAKQFSSELSLILRRNGDLDTERTTSNPGSDEIKANLERLLFSWKDCLPKETLHQLECLRKHIQRGCLLDIPPGCGTEKNERFTQTYY